MKTFLAFAFSAAVTWPAAAGPLVHNRVAADARWVVHLDVEALLRTAFGQTLAREALDPKLEEPSAALKKEYGFDFDWRRIRSVTLYGSEFGAPDKLGGVMLVDTDLDVAGGLEAARAKLAAAGRSGSSELERVEEGAAPLYRLLGEVFVAPGPEAPVIVGKVREATLNARKVLTRSAPSLKAGEGFGAFCQPGDGFFFVAAAQGFTESAPIPPQAQVLKMADGFRLQLGEVGKEVRANLALSTRTIEGAQQIQQIAQGLLALGMLTQADNPDLQNLLQGTRVARADKIVTLNLTLPSSMLSQKFVEEQLRKHGTN
jgi:hypothetical protein